MAIGAPAIASVTRAEDPITVVSTRPHARDHPAAPDALGGHHWLDPTGLDPTGHDPTELDPTGPEPDPELDGPAGLLVDSDPTTDPPEADGRVDAASPATIEAHDTVDALPTRPRPSPRPQAQPSEPDEERAGTEEPALSMVAGTSRRSRNRTGDKRDDIPRANRHTGVPPTTGSLAPRADTPDARGVNGSIRDAEDGDDQHPPTAS